MANGVGDSHVRAAPRPPLGAEHGVAHHEAGEGQHQPEQAGGHVVERALVGGGSSRARVRNPNSTAPTVGTASSASRRAGMQTRIAYEEAGGERAGYPRYGL